MKAMMRVVTGQIIMKKQSCQLKWFWFTPSCAASDHAPSTHRDMIISYI